VQLVPLTLTRDILRINKYKGSLEDLAKLSKTYLGDAHVKESSRRLFTLLLVNYALRNADAHLKNFAVVYSGESDVRLAPVYDIVTVTAYAAFESDIPALPLAGKRVWASGRLLALYGGAQLGLSSAEINDCVARVTGAVHEMLPKVCEYANRYPEFREVGKRMLDAWAQGLEDIKPDARAGRSEPAALRAQSGLSGEAQSGKKKKSKPYVDADSAFGHQSR
jgi:serine/threonine-protein kinase HipA